MGSYRIMSFDGGPGVVTFLQCLIRLEKDRPGLIQSTNMFVGSSAGSWLAAYLAWNMRLVDAKTITGLKLLENSYVFAQQAFQKLFPPNLPVAYLKFLEGQGPLTNFDEVETYMRQPGVYGDTTLGQVRSVRRLVISAARAEAPWAPRFYDSAHPSDGTERLYNAALCSASLPLLVAIRDGQVDGGMFCNDPAMIGLVQALKGTSLAPPVPLADVRLLACGQDDGSSRLSNIFMPGQMSLESLTPREARSLPSAAAPSNSLSDTPRAEVPALGGMGSPAADPSDNVSDLHMHLDCLCKTLDSAKKDLDLPLPVQTSERVLAPATAALAGESKPSAPRAPAPGGLRLPDDPFFRATLQLFDTLDKEAKSQLVDLEELGTDLTRTLERLVRRAGQLVVPSEQAWGWPQWLAYPMSPLFLMQVLWNSQGRGIAALCSQMLGPRTLRLAPSGLLTINSALALTCIGKLDVIFEFGTLTAWQWASVFWQPLYQFKPGIVETRAWIDAQWPRSP
jgi:hypothetical protein